MTAGAGSARRGPERQWFGRGAGLGRGGGRHPSELHGRVRPDRGRCICEAGYGLHFLARWVRELGEFDLPDGVRRLTSRPADLYGTPDRGRIETGAWADLLLFDPDTVGVTPAERVADIPGGGRRTIRRPIGVHGVFCNGVEVFDGADYVVNGRGPGRILDRFVPSSAFSRASGNGAHRES